jgi:uncharacterized lipoprotein NlpE involved in copper resistance
MKKYGITLLAAIMILSSCENDSNKEESPELVVNENAATFKKWFHYIGMGAAEISAYDEVSKSYLL